jgi:hypothetical protein
MTARFLILTSALFCFGVTAQALEPIVLAPEGTGFVGAETRRPFHPWGLNYGNAGRLMEDFWDRDWETLAGDFREVKALGGNVVRIHLQFGKFMDSAEQANAAALGQLKRLLAMAEECGVYVDVTGLACYRPAEVPAWYDALDEAGRWKAQARFWSAVAQTCASSPAVFCYDLLNEPISPGEKRGAGKWRSGALLGEYDFLQYIALELAGRERAEIAVAWIRQLTTAIREHDQRHLVTVGMLPWSRQWKHLSGFLPEKVAPELDFLSVHIYPESKQPEEALEGLRQFVIPGKPLVIEETFPLTCTVPELEAFLRASKVHATGWIGHYDGMTLAEYDALAKAGKLTIPQTIYRSFLELFVKLRPEFAP